MKYSAIIFFIFGLSILAFSQQTISGSITHDDIQRDYILYVPAIYTGDVPVPLILNFHGYTSNANEQMVYGDFRSIADTAGFIIVHPQGTLFEGNTHWNVGGWTVGSTVDDVGFTDALIDSLGLNYTIDLTKIYATGMSNGGFMSFLLSCQLSARIAAVASVTGSMTPETYIDCNPDHPTPILQMHGTADFVVPYGGTIWSKPIDDVLLYWVNYNNCNTSATITALPDIDPTDGSTVEHFLFDGGNNNVNVEHYKVYGGGHTWPGSAIGGTGTNYDINASAEIWKFFLRYDINGSITGINELSDNNPQLTVYPNPTSGLFDLKTSERLLSVKISDITGKEIRINQSRIKAGTSYSKINNQLQLLHTIDLSDFENGLYILSIQTENNLITRKIVKN